MHRERRAALCQDSIASRFLNRQPADSHARDTVDHHEAIEFRIRAQPDTGSIDDGASDPGEGQPRCRDGDALATRTPNLNRLPFPGVPHGVSKRLPAVTVHVLRRRASAWVCAAIVPPSPAAHRTTGPRLRQAQSILSGRFLTSSVTPFIGSPASGRDVTYPTESVLRPSQGPGRSAAGVVSVRSGDGSSALVALESRG